jgi:outer membrane immunogenic protein
LGFPRYADAWIFGFEAQADWANLRASRTSNTLFFVAPGDVTNRSRIDAFGLLTVQAGYAWRDVLLYAKGGGASSTSGSGGKLFHWYWPHRDGNGGTSFIP